MIPLSFLVGAAVGVTGTYVYKDEPAKQWVTDTSKKIKAAAASFLDSMKKKPEAEKPVESPVATTAQAEVVVTPPEPQQTTQEAPMS